MSMLRLTGFSSISPRLALYRIGLHPVLGAGFRCFGASGHDEIDPPLRKRWRELSLPGSGDALTSEMK
jgi:hypothetical protein